PDALLTDLAHVTEAEYLETAGIGQDRPVPTNELMQPPMAAHHISARAQHQVKSVSQQNLRPALLDLRRRHALDGAVGTHRHEGGRLHLAPGKLHGAAPSQPISILY